MHSGSFACVIHVARMRCHTHGQQHNPNHQKFTSLARDTGNPHALHPPSLLPRRVCRRATSPVQPFALPPSPATRPHDSLLQPPRSPLVIQAAAVPQTAAHSARAWIGCPDPWVAYHPLAPRQAADSRVH